MRWKIEEKTLRKKWNKSCCFWGKLSHLKTYFFWGNDNRFIGLDVWPRQIYFHCTRFYGSLVLISRPIRHAEREACKTKVRLIGKQLETILFILYYLKFWYWFAESFPNKYFCKRHWTNTFDSCLNGRIMTRYLTALNFKWRGLIKIMSALLTVREIFLLEF